MAAAQQRARTAGRSRTEHGRALLEQIGPRPRATVHHGDRYGTPRLYTTIAGIGIDAVRRDDADAGAPRRDGPSAPATFGQDHVVDPTALPVLALGGNLPEREVVILRHANVGVVGCGSGCGVRARVLAAMSSEPSVLQLLTMMYSQF